MSYTKAFKFPNDQIVIMYPGTRIRIYVRSYTANKKLYKDFPEDEAQLAVNEFNNLQLPPKMRKHLYVSQNGEEFKIMTQKGQHPTAPDPFKLVAQKSTRTGEWYQVTLSRVPMFLEMYYRNFGYKSFFGTDFPKKERFLTLCVMAYFFTCDQERQKTMLNLGRSKLLEVSRKSLDKEL